MVEDWRQAGLYELGRATVYLTHFWTEFSCLVRSLFGAIRLNMSSTPTAG